MTNNTIDGLDPRGSHIGEMTTLGEVTIDHDYRPDSEWLTRFKEKVRQEAEAHKRDKANHPEDYQDEDIDE